MVGTPSNRTFAMTPDAPSPASALDATAAPRDSQWLTLPGALHRSADPAVAAEQLAEQLRQAHARIGQLETELEAARARACRETQVAALLQASRLLEAVLPISPQYANAPQVANFRRALAPLVNPG